MAQLSFKIKIGLQQSLGVLSRSIVCSYPEILKARILDPEDILNMEQMQALSPSESDESS